MYAVTTAFKAAADDPQRIPDKKFSFVAGVTDRSDKLLRMGQFRQKQYEGDALNSANISVDLLNDSKEFNFLITDKTNIGKAGRLEIGFNGEFINRYRGYLEEVKLQAQDRPQCQMVFGGRIQRALEIKIDSSADPDRYYSTAFNPADIVWDLLVTQGGLDFTATPANTDIDYTSFLDYKATCDDLAFLLRAEFKGQSIAEALRIIGELTDAIIYGETDGKIYMKKFRPRSTPSTPYLFTDVKAHLQSAEIYLNKDRLRNRAITWWGYSPTSNDWASGGTSTQNNATSQTKFGLFAREFDGTTVWHDNPVSADAFGERYVSRYSEPQETVEFKTKNGTQALIHQIGDDIQLTWDQIDYAAVPMRIHGIVGDMARDTYEILAEKTDGLADTFFVLDSPTQGKLDINILF